MRRSYMGLRRQHGVLNGEDVGCTWRPRGLYSASAEAC